MRIRERVARLEGRFPALPSSNASEGDPALDPAEHERLFGYSLITADMTAADAARHYLATVRSTVGGRAQGETLPAGMTTQRAAELYREILG